MYLQCAIISHSRSPCYLFTCMIMLKWLTMLKINALHKPALKVEHLIIAIIALHILLDGDSIFHQDFQFLPPCNADVS